MAGSRLRHLSTAMLCTRSLACVNMPRLRMLVQNMQHCDLPNSCSNGEKPLNCQRPSAQGVKGHAAIILNSPGPGDTRTPAGFIDRISSTVFSSFLNTTYSVPVSPKYCKAGTPAYRGSSFDAAIHPCPAHFRRTWHILYVKLS